MTIPPHSAPKRGMIVGNAALPQCNKYRLHQKAALLAHAGQTADIYTLPQLSAARERLPEAAWLVIYRLSATPEVLALITAAQKAGIPTYWEADDAVFAPLPDANDEQKAAAHAYCNALLACDAAIASTAPLRDAMRHAGASAVYLVPNGLDAQTLACAEAPALPNNQTVTAFYGAGWHTHNANMQAIAAAFLRAMEQHPQLHLCLMGHVDVPKELQPWQARIRLLPFAAFEDYMAALRQCDFALAPLEDNPFTRCKSNVKYLESAASGIPLLASHVPAYHTDITHDENGLLATTPDDWLRAISRLCEDAALRQRLGRAAQEHVHRHYMVDAICATSDWPILHAARPATPAPTGKLPPEILPRAALLQRAITAPYHEDASVAAEHILSHTAFLQATAAAQDVTASIILPTFNRAHCLQQAIDSVLAQTHPHWELLVIDDGSTDDTPTVMQQYQDARIRYLRLPENQGQSAARNHGLEAACGEWIAYLDSDNRMEPDFLRLMLHAAAQSPQHVLAYCAQRCIGYTAEGSEISRSIRFAAFDRQRIAEENYIDIGAVMHRKSLWDDIGGFNPAMRSWEDWEWLLRATEQHTPLAVPAVLCEYRHGHVANQINRDHDAKTARLQLRTSLLDARGKNGQTAAVDIIIAVRNITGYLAETLASVQAQSHAPAHIFVIDDYSDDAARQRIIDICAAIPNLTLLHQPFHLGVASARERGIRRSTADYVILLDADDCLPADAIARHVAFLDNAPQAIASYGRQVRIDENSTPIDDAPRPPMELMLGGHELLEAMLSGAHIIQSGGAMCIRREAFRHIQPDHHLLKSGEDAVLWCHLALYGDIEPLGDSVTLLRRKHYDNVSGKILQHPERAFAALETLYRHPAFHAVFGREKIREMETTSTRLLHAHLARLYAQQHNRERAAYHMRLTSTFHAPEHPSSRLHLPDDTTITVTASHERMLQDIDRFAARWQALATCSPERLEALPATPPLTQAIRKPQFFVAQKRDVPLTEEAILAAHRQAFTHRKAGAELAGQYKTRRNSIRRFGEDGEELGVIVWTPHAEHVPALIQRLITWHNKALAENTLHPLVRIALFYVSFVTIHPFQDANGRTARLLANRMLLQAGYAYTPFHALEDIILRRIETRNHAIAISTSEKSLYSDTPDFTPWLDFFLHVLHVQAMELADFLHAQGME